MRIATFGAHATTAHATDAHATTAHATTAHATTAHATTAHATDTFVLRAPWVPGLEHYWVLHLRDPERVLDDQERRALLATATETARALALEIHGDPECYSLLFNGGRTRRTQGDHVHILLSTSVAAKRRRFVWLHLKHVLRPIARLLCPR
ncbi:MAG: hypothetical protein AAGE52_15500 [Myxococcota bacterium]